MLIDRRLWTGYQAPRQVIDHDFGAVDVVAAPDGGWLAIACRDRTVRLWDMGSGTLRQTLSGPTVDFGGYGSLVAGRDGRRVAGHWADGIVWVGDVTTGESRTHRIDDVVSGPQVAIAPDSERLVLGLQGSVQLRDAGTFALLDRFDIGVENQVRRLAIAPDGSWLASAADAEIIIWDAATGRVRAKLTNDFYVQRLAITPSGRWLASLERRGAVTVWDPHDATVVAQLWTGSKFPTQAWPGSCVWSPDGTGLCVVIAGEAYVLDLVDR